MYGKNVNEVIASNLDEQTKIELQKSFVEEQSIHGKKTGEPLGAQLIRYPYPHAFDSEEWKWESKGVPIDKDLLLLDGSVEDDPDTLASWGFTERPQGIWTGKCLHLSTRGFYFQPLLNQ